MKCLIDHGLLVQPAGCCKVQAKRLAKEFWLTAALEALVEQVIV